MIKNLKINIPVNISYIEENETAMINEITYLLKAFQTIVSEGGFESLKAFDIDKAPVYSALRSDTKDVEF